MKKFNSHFQIDVSHFKGFELRQEPTASIVAEIVADFDEAARIFGLIPETEVSKFSSQVEVFLLKSSSVAAAVYNSKLDTLTKKVAISFLERNVQIEKKFHQVCPEVALKNNPGERTFQMMIYVLTDSKRFKEAMMTIADCLVSTTPASGLEISQTLIERLGVSWVEINRRLGEVLILFISEK